MDILRKTVIHVGLCLIIFVFLISIYELYSSWNATQCGLPDAKPRCYPWGNEGPAAGSEWAYQTKENYIKLNIISGIISLIGLILAKINKNYRFVTVIITGTLLYFGGFLAKNLT
jgi:hypothetical protein